MHRDLGLPHRTATTGHHLLGEEAHNTSLEEVASSPEQISNRLMQQMLHNTKQLDPNTLIVISEPGDDNDTDLALISSQEGFSEPMAHQQEHIIQSHSESARNALIYIAVILFIYLVAVAFIAVQYYRKHSTLDPLTAYILRRSTRKSTDVRSAHNRKHRRRHSASSGAGFETFRNMATSVSLLGLF